jgi:major membrane immunogen (membrane-anchored lipoprotein)
MRRPGSPAPRKSGKNVIGRRLFEDEYEYRDAEYEYEYRDAEYEYERKYEQSIAPKYSIESF